MILSWCLWTYVVLHEVGVVLLYPIVQDGHHHSFTGEARLPGSLGIQVTVVGIVLAMTEQKPYKHSSAGRVSISDSEQI